jgi:Pyridine nucleotide-disulphide oxidoreductase
LLVGIGCAGMRANPLTAQLGVERDRLGRVPVDDYLWVTGVSDVFAAGDSAAARMDDKHLSMMSCPHGRSMGRIAGYNVVSELLGEPMLPLRIPWYVTVLDLGLAGASTPKAGIGRWPPMERRRRPPSAPSTPSESIHRSTETEMKSWPAPPRPCSPAGSRSLEPRPRTGTRSPAANWRAARRRVHPPAQMIGPSSGRRTRSHR